MENNLNTPPSTPVRSPYKTPPRTLQRTSDIAPPAPVSYTHLRAHET